MRRDSCSWCWFLSLACWMLSSARASPETQQRQHLLSTAVSSLHHHLGGWDGMEEASVATTTVCDFCHRQEGQPTLHSSSFSALTLACHLADDDSWRFVSTSSLPANASEPTSFQPSPPSPSLTGNEGEDSFRSSSVNQEDATADFIICALVAAFVALQYRDVARTCQ